VDALLDLSSRDAPPKSRRSARPGVARRPLRPRRDARIGWVRLPHLRIGKERPLSAELEAALDDDPKPRRHGFIRASNRSFGPPTCGLDAFEDVRLDSEEALDLVRCESGSRQPTDQPTHLPACCPEFTPARGACGGPSWPSSYR
jgi:hypothetical protein